jgi:hypothetical protein
MDLARYVVDAVIVEHRTYREVAAAHGVSKSHVGKLVASYREGGDEAIAPRSRSAKRNPHRCPMSWRMRSLRSANSCPTWAWMPEPRRSTTTCRSPELFVGRFVGVGFVRGGGGVFSEPPDHTV